MLNNISFIQHIYSLFIEKALLNYIVVYRSFFNISSFLKGSYIGFLLRTVASFSDVSPFFSDVNTIFSDVKALFSDVNTKKSD
jgi:hypothetical protein